MTQRLPARAALGGALCLAILGGMIVGHAWPLWTGRTLVLAAAAVGKGEQHGSGEYLRLTTPATLLALDPVQGTDSLATYVRTVGAGWDAVSPGPGGARRLRGRVVYVQLEPAPGGVYAPVSVSFSAVPGATNLRGRIRGWSQGGQKAPTNVRVIALDCGLEAFYLPEGHAQEIANATGKNGSIQVEIALAASGQARITRLIVNGRPVS